MSVKKFLGHIALNLIEIKKITTQYKAEPEIAVDKIMEIAERENFPFRKEEFINAVVDFVKGKNQLAEYLQNKSIQTMTINEIEVPNLTGINYGEANDEIIYYTLDILDWECLQNLYNLKK